MESLPQENKLNLCTPDGACTVESGNEEDGAFHTRSELCGICIYRAWFFDKCLSPFALMAAREKAAA